MAIRAVAMDVDGVLTDGTVGIDDSGHESKRLAFADIMGISLGRRAGLAFALISGEGGALFDAIAAKVGITETYPSCRDKAGALRDFATKHDLALAEVCFIGDDINDVPAFEICGLAVAPADAHPTARARATRVTALPGGGGSVREVIDGLISSRWETEATIGRSTLG
ncbi:MAG: KdsC family phosphatase [Candidatus Limnocylindrales bacterium]